MQKSYLSAPGLGWGAMLKMTKIELELISDPDMYIFFEKSRRGEISYISNRYSKTCSNCAHKTSIRCTTKRATKINNQVCFTKFL